MYGCRDRVPEGVSDDLHMYSGVYAMKFREGQYNKVFQLVMDNGAEVVAKIPNPNCGPAYYTTASEVATVDFVIHQIPCGSKGLNISSFALFWGFQSPKFFHGVRYQRTQLVPSISSWKRPKASFSVSTGIPSSGMPRTQSSAK